MSALVSLSLQTLAIPPAQNNQTGPFYAPGADNNMYKYLLRSAMGIILYLCFFHNIKKQYQRFAGNTEFYFGFDS